MAIHHQKNRVGDDYHHRYELEQRMLDDMITNTFYTQITEINEFSVLQKGVIIRVNLQFLEIGHLDDFQVTTLLVLDSL